MYCCSSDQVGDSDPEVVSTLRGASGGATTCHLEHLHRSRVCRGAGSAEGEHSRRNDHRNLSVQLYDFFSDVITAMMNNEGEPQQLSSVTNGQFGYRFIDVAFFSIRLYRDIPIYSL